MHINGDILNRLFDRGGEVLLEGMLEQGSEERQQDRMDLDSRNEGDINRLTGFGDASAKRKRFKELVAEVAMLAEGERDVAAVVQWMRLKLVRAL